ncbi:hypothetical protein EUX98_g88 [Antrodiella citrinella]|uniref:Transaldolase n=1 Tax=Antrodiella citrinella TaxID=2447956 RepID=A0A4S4N707_9APHY|nr:hypothetical protein EUX98_g88 [Antrodiella citrinella]
MSVTLLTQLRERLVVDVDSMDPAVAANHSKDARFCDMTSNQGIALAEASRPDRARVLTAACLKVKESIPSGSLEEQVTTALDILTVLFAKEVLPYIEKRVHAQTSPSAAYDTKKTIAHALRLVEEFEANGIPRSKVCIKIPVTPESVLACRDLQKQGINTLGTCLFNLPQALAASQAGCLYVAPYFNELRVHVDAATWKKYENTVGQHPMIAVIGTILKAYKTLGIATLVMPASIVTPDEILALAALYPDHLTISAKILDLLAVDNTTQLDSVKAPAFSPPTGLDIDYLVDDAKALKDAFAADAESARKMADALKIFNDAEEQTKELIRIQLSVL